MALTAQELLKLGYFGHEPEGHRLMADYCAILGIGPDDMILHDMLAEGEDWLCQREGLPPHD